MRELRQRIETPWIALLALTWACSEGSSGAKPLSPDDAGGQDASVSGDGGDAGCGEDRAPCGSQCVNIESDVLNCGGCDHACESGLQCEGGQCVLPKCDEGTLCDGACRDFTTDRRHCGGCFQACETEEICREGKCECPPEDPSCNAPNRIACGQGYCVPPQLCSSINTCILPGSCAADGDCKDSERCGAAKKCIPALPSFAEIDNAFKQESNGIKLAFSHQGPIRDMTCVAMAESSDKHQAWEDNYFCSSPDVGLSWQSSRRPCGKRTVNIFEEGEPKSSTWDDNALCYDSCKFTLLYSQDNRPTWSDPKISLADPKESALWSDNRVFVRWTRGDEVCFFENSIFRSRLNTFSQTTFPNRLELADGNDKFINPGKVVVDSVRLDSYGDLRARVTFSGNTEERFPGGTSYVCKFDYTGSIDVVGQYDSSSGILTLRAEPYRTPIDYSWSTPGTGLCSIYHVERHGASVESRLRFVELRINVGTADKLALPFGLAEHPF